jgi:virulence factor Mce-like protein
VNRTGNDRAGALTNPVLVGASIVIALVIGVFLSYNANKGLPFVQTYKLTADVPDAAELVVGSEVRIGGFRVGQVNGIEAVPPKDDKPPYAHLLMDLDGTITGVPADTVVRVRPRSLLGAKFVELEPGTGKQLASGAALPLGNARATPELDETFNTFDAGTRKGLQGTIRAFGDATAGRGPDINRSIAAMRRLLPPLQRVAATLADKRTNLDGFVAGVASAMGALAPVSDDLGRLLHNGAVTLKAIDGAGPALEQGLARLPATEALGTTALRDITPVAGDLADLAAALRDGTTKLPSTVDRLSSALAAGTRTLRRTSRFTAPLTRTLQSLDVIATDARAPSALAGLTTTVRLLRPTLTDLQAAQLHCNVGGLFARNTSSAVTRGDALGSWLSFVPIMRSQQSDHESKPDPDLHVDTVPTLNGTECESGNEPYSPGQVIGSPAGVQPNTTEETRPPAGATARAATAGLLDRIPGATR